jgi:flagellar hook-associated protein 1 FlgK
MSSGLFSIGTSALNAAYTALRTASNNVANVNTPGYSRQITVLRPEVGSYIGGNYLGRGVAVADVRRVYSDFLTQQAHQAQAQAAGTAMRHRQLAQVANLFGDPTTGIGTAIDAFYGAVQDLTQRPADPAARQALLAAAHLMVGRFNDVGDRLQDMRNSADRQLRFELDAVNLTTREIAALNSQIAFALGSGSTPNDLLDQRDVALRRLSESFSVSTVEQSDGSLNVFLGGGQPLVIGGTANEMGWVADALDPQAARVGLRTGGGVLPLDPAAIGGGRVGGLLQFREIDLPAIENQLGRLAATLTELANAQHRLGDDRNGAPGGDLFRPTSGLAFAAAGNGNPATTISVQITDATQLVASDYRVDYAGGQYRLTRLADGQTWTQAGATFVQDGLTITLAATPPADGDRFVVQPLRGASRDMAVAISDIHRIAAAAPLVASAPLANTGAVRVDEIAVLAPRTAEATLKRPATLTFTSPTDYSISDGVTTVTGTYSEGQPIDFNGWRLTLRGAPAAGDTVEIAANVGGVGDNRNALKLAQLGNLALVDGSTLANGFAAVVAGVGGATRSAELLARAQTNILDSALAAESGLAGVNLDEEASRLMQYQQQYQAAAKIIATAKIVFEEILSMGR